MVTSGKWDAHHHGRKGWNNLKSPDSTLMTNIMIEVEVFVFR